MIGVDLLQVQSNRTKFIDFNSDDDFDCSISWHCSVNKAEKHRKPFQVDSFKI